MFKGWQRFSVVVLSLLSCVASTVIAAACEPRAQQHFRLPANIHTVQQGFFSKSLDPVLTIQSGDFVTVETVTHHSDKDERMMLGDPGVESIFASRTSGHILTGPIEVCGAQPGDILEVRILDLYPRPSRHPDAVGKTYGANLGGGGGFLYNPLVFQANGETPPRVVTIYEVDASGLRTWARADHSYVMPGGSETVTGVLEGYRVPIRPHFGILGVAPSEAEVARSGPPAYFGGNIDDWRIGKGGTMYYPIAVPGALLVAGDPHAAQGDSELSGTAIEMSLTGVIQVILHKQKETAGTILDGLAFPLLETKDEFIVHGFTFPNYLSELGVDAQDAQNQIYNSSSLDSAMYDAARKMLWLLTDRVGLSEAEAYSLMSVAVDFGVTQVANGNWGIHSILRKDLLGEVDVLGSFSR